jgi:TonB family protein
MILPPEETLPRPTAAPPQQTQQRTKVEQLAPVETPKPSPARPREAPLEKQGSILVPPQPVWKVMPDAQLVARTTISSPIQVRIILDINAKGHVTAAHMANGEMPRSALAQAALEAARLWIFQPATLRGRKIASQHQIVFEFSGNQR